MGSQGNRIAIIDTFRAVAAIWVICYHFFYSLSPPHSAVNYLSYPYEPNVLTMYGYYGVNLFFVISGFVISLTLENSTSFSAFMKRRLLRLMPCLILCALITFVMKEWIYDHWSFIQTGSYLDLLPSLTFLPPSFWNFVLGRHDMRYIDGPYWTLFVEMVFYVVAGLTFFLDRRSFTRNWIRAIAALTLVRMITSPTSRFIFPDSLHAGLDTVYSLYLELHISYWVYFGLGVFFYHLFSRKQLQVEIIVLTALLVIAEFYFLYNDILRVLFFSLMVLFSIFIYRATWLAFLKNRILLWIGLISYPLYLLHVAVGITLMDKLAALNPIDSLNKYLPVFAILILLVAADLIHRFIEIPVTAFLKQRMSEKTRSQEVAG